MTITPYIPPSVMSSLPRGNLLTYSNTLTNGVWAPTNCTLFQGVLDPLGGTTGWTLSRTATGNCYVYQSASLGNVVTGVPYTISVWAKLGTLTGAISLVIQDALGANFTNLTFTPTSTWTRYSWTGTLPATATLPMQIGVNPQNTGGSAGDTLRLWNFDLVQGTTPSVDAFTTSTADLGIWGGVSGYPVMPFLAGQSIDMSKSPLWNTKVVQAASGKERRTALRAYPLWQFALKYETIRQRPTLDEVATFYEFFNTAQGKYLPWLYVDPTDNQVTGQQFGTGNASTTVFQLSRSIRTWVEPVRGVYDPLIYVNGTLKTLGTDYTLTGNGVVTFTSAPANAAVLTWSGYFYYLCRFDQDDLTLTQVVNQLWNGSGLKFTSTIP